MNKEYLAKKIEVALLKPETSKEDILNACEKIKQYKFGAFVVNPCYLKLIKSELEKEKDIRVVSVVDFPFGAGGVETKILQSYEAFLHGANDLDIVINIGALKSKDYKKVSNEIKEVRKEMQDITIKAIIETALLTEKEIEKASQICLEAGADYIKTNTGFFERKRNLVDEIKLIKPYTDKAGKKIKASAGIRDLQLIEELEKLKVHAYGIGLESAIKILESLK